MLADPVSGTKVCRVCGGTFPADFVVCPKDATPLAESNTVDPLLGATLGGTYRIVSMLGGGAMGRVYEAEHTRIDRRYAVKVIQELYAQVTDVVERFKREARALSRIQSDHVVDVVDVLTTPDGRPAIVAELLVGEDLQACLDREGKLSLATAVPIARQICAGLAAAHALGVVHRDLKPSNVFLAKARPGSKDVADAETVAKILDFGVAKLADDPQLTKTGAVVGTPMYMAPEQARGSSVVDARVDVYSAGAVLYRMLTGHSPYEGDDPGVTLHRVLEEDPPRPRTHDKSIPDALEVVIQNAMARDPRTRTRSVTELDRQLAPFDVRGAAAIVGAGAGPEEAAASIQQAVEDAGRLARIARPVAVALGVPVGVAAGVSTAAVIGSLVTAANAGSALSPTERVLVLLPSGALAGVALFAYVRALRASWRATPSVQRLIRRVGGALSFFTGALGLFELAIRTYDAFAGSTFSHSTGIAVARIGLAAAIGGLGLWLRRR